MVVVRGEEEEGAGGKERSRGGAAGEKETGVERAVKSQERSQWLGGRTELGRGAARVSPPAFGPRLGRDLFSRRRRRPPIRFRRRSSASPQPSCSLASHSQTPVLDRPAPPCLPCRRLKNADLASALRRAHTPLLFARPPFLSIHSSFSALNKAPSASVALETMGSED